VPKNLTIYYIASLNTNICNKSQIKYYIAPSPNQLYLPPSVKEMTKLLAFAPKGDVSVAYWQEVSPITAVPPSRDFNASIPAPQPQLYTFSLVLSQLQLCSTNTSSLHQHQFTLLHMVAMHGPDNTLNQHAMYMLHNSIPNSWFFCLRQTAAQYSLPDLLQILVSPPPKLRFKAKVKSAINDFWHASLVRQSASLPSLGDTS
jgi:hypothetical protein